MAAYVLLRGVALCRKSFRLRRQVADRRRELEAWLEDKRERQWQKTVRIHGIAASRHGMSNR